MQFWHYKYIVSLTKAHFLNKNLFFMLIYPSIDLIQKIYQAIYQMKGR